MEDRGNGPSSEDFQRNSEGQADPQESPARMAEIVRRTRPSAWWRIFGSALYDVTDPSSHLKERARYLYRVRFNLRALSEAALDQIASELGCAFDDEMAQLMASGWDELDAEARVCASWKAPEALAKDYANVHSRSGWALRSWLPDLAAAVPVALILGPHIPYAVIAGLFPHLDGWTAAVISATAAITAGGTLVRRLPIGFLSRGAHKALEYLERATRWLYVGCAASTAITFTTTMNVDIHSLTVTLVVDHMTRGCMASVAALVVLEINRRKMRQHKTSLVVFLDPRKFGQRQFARVREDIAEMSRKIGYFTEDL